MRSTTAIERVSSDEFLRDFGRYVAENAPVIVAAPDSLECLKPSVNPRNSGEFRYRRTSKPGKPAND